MTLSILRQMKNDLLLLHKTKIWMKNKRKKTLSSDAWPGQKGAKINLT